MSTPCNSATVAVSGSTAPPPRGNATYSTLGLCSQGPRFTALAGTMRAIVGNASVNYLALKREACV